MTSPKRQPRAVRDAKPSFISRDGQQVVSYVGEAFRMYFGAGWETNVIVIADNRRVLKKAFETINPLYTIDFTKVKRVRVTIIRRARTRSRP